MRGALRKLLPFALGLLVGCAAAGLFAWRSAGGADAEQLASPPARAVLPPAQYELPRMRVLSMMTMDEVMSVQQSGREIEEAVILHPPGVQ